MAIVHLPFNTYILYPILHFALYIYTVYGSTRASQPSWSTFALIAYTLSIRFGSSLPQTASVCIVYCVCAYHECVFISVVYYYYYLLYTSYLHYNKYMLILLLTLHKSYTHKLIHYICLYTQVLPSVWTPSARLTLSSCPLDTRRRSSRYRVLHIMHYC